MSGWARVAIASGVLAGGLVFVQFLSRGEAIPLRRGLEEFPVQLDSYRGTEQELEANIVRALGVTDVMLRRYTAPGRLPIWLYIAYYASQRTGAVIHSPRQCLPGTGWTIVKSEWTSVGPFASATPPVMVNRVVVARGEERQLVLYWYQERGRAIASEYRGKAYLAWDAVTRNRTDGAIVRLSTPLAGSGKEALAQSAEFARLIIPRLSEFLPE